MSKNAKVIALTVMTSFLLVNAVFIIKGSENFPFTACPMFAHYIGEDTQFYNFKFIGVYNSGLEEILSPTYGKDSEMISMRFFFGKVYGATETISPFGQMVDETPHTFENRLSTYFDYYLRSTDQSSLEGIQSVRLEVWKYDGESERVVEKRSIGSYDVSTKRFRHTWLH